MDVYTLTPDGFYENEPWNGTYISTEYLLKLVLMYWVTIEIFIFYRGLLIRYFAISTWSKGAHNIINYLVKEYSNTRQYNYPANIGSYI